MAKQDWQKIWAEQDLNQAADKARLEEEMATLRWREMQGLLEEHFSSIKGLQTIEVGAGLGDFSIILNWLGAKTTLADYSEKAIAKAKERFALYGCVADFVLADMLNVPKKLQDKYDMSFSLGLGEHFRDKERAQIIAAHAKVLRSGGLTFISIPYKYCPLYQIWMRRLILTKTWSYGLEIPFSRHEIQRLGEAAGLRTVGFIQSSFWGDWNRFFPSHRINKLLPNHLEKTSPLNRLGYALVYVGQKP